MWKLRILIFTSQLQPTYYFSSPPSNFLENLPYHPQMNNVILQIRTSLHAKIQQFLNNLNFGLSFQICRPLEFFIWLTPTFINAWLKRLITFKYITPSLVSLPSLHSTNKYLLDKIQENKNKGHRSAVKSGFKNVFLINLFNIFKIK